MLLLLTYRSDEIPPGLHHFLASFDRERLADEFILIPLSLEDSQRFMDALLGRSVLREFVERLAVLTEGNPFFIEEVFRSLRMTGDEMDLEQTWEREHIEGLHIPRSIEELVRRRSEALSDSARDLLTLAAVAGRRFDFTLLQAITGKNEQELLQNIKELIKARLVVEESAERFAFRHALTREAVYARLLLRERIRLHLRIGEALEGIHLPLRQSQATSPFEQGVSDLAYHFYQAEAWDKALEYARLAGEHAQQLYAPQETVIQLSHALEAAQHLSQAPPADLYQMRGRAYELLGEFEHAEEDFLAAIHQMGVDGKTQWQGLVNLGSLWASRDYSRTGGYLQQALELANAMADPLLQATSLNRVGNWYVNMERAMEARPYHQEALAIFGRLNDQAGLAQTYDLMGLMSLKYGDMGQAKSYWERAVALFRGLEDRMGLVSCLTSLALCGAHHIADPLSPGLNLPESVTFGEEAQGIAGEINWRGGEIYAGIVTALCCQARGQYARAFELIQDSLRLAREIEHNEWRAAARCQLGGWYRDLLALPQAQDHLNQALSLAKSTGSMIWMHNTLWQLIEIYLQQNKLAQAEAVLEDCLKNEPNSPGMPLEKQVYPRAAIALARGDASNALQMMDSFLGKVDTANREIVLPYVWKLRAEALMQTKQFSKAEAVLEEAAQAADQWVMLPLVWRIHIMRGKVYQALGRNQDKEAAFTAARQLIKEIAQTVPDVELQQNFRKQALALTSPSYGKRNARALKEMFGGLTAREREVAALVAQGKQNQEIAQVLYVGVRTIETHITHIFQKLDFSSRTQIATWVIETGLLEEIEPRGDERK